MTDLQNESQRAQNFESKTSPEVCTNLEVSATSESLVNPNAERWSGKPYHPISLFYREKFGGKVVKVPVSIATDCPNRMGIKGAKVCIFCDQWGSFAYPDSRDNSLRTQIEEHRAKVGERFNARQFLVYFQAYTTTFTQAAKLTEAFHTALEYDDVAGIVLGTRPDCLSEALLRTWRDFSEKTFLAIELGVQSFDDHELQWMERGHTALQAIKGIERVYNETGIKPGLHLMFGWPTETDEQIIHTAKICNALPIHNVKLHNLHVLKHTPLEQLYNDGSFRPIELDAYAHRVGLFLQHLSPEIAVHRLVALSSKWEELIAPVWVRHKMRSYQAVIDHLNDHGMYQGQFYSPSKATATELLLEGF